MNSTPLVLVGTGEYYAKILKPALRLLALRGVAHLACTVDVRRRTDDGSDFSDVEHRMRAEDEPLSTLLQDVLPENPVVILGHANHMHVSDATDLVRAGFRVLLEKPFALSREELGVLSGLIREFPASIGLIEYYLTMKSAPLYAVTGQLGRESFFFSENLIADNTQRAGNPVLGADLLTALGKPLSVVVDVLEGEGTVGRLDHRGRHLIARSLGGGMIQDLGIHAIAPLIPLSDWIGSLGTPTGVKTARCREYYRMASELHGLASSDIAESYAEMTFRTSRDVPVTVRVGKYVLDNRNQRGITVVTEKGQVTLDLSNPSVSVEIGGAEYQEVYTLPKTEEKYYPVLRTSLLALEDRSPYSFSVNEAGEEAQRRVLESLAAHADEPGYQYQAGASPSEIFS